MPSVPSRPGQSRRRPSARARQGDRARQPARSASATTTLGLRQVRRAGRVEHEPAWAHELAGLGRAARRCSAVSSGRSSGERRHRASGRRRRAPSPVHGASTRTRSNPPAEVQGEGVTRRAPDAGRGSVAGRCGRARPDAGAARPRSADRRGPRPLRPAAPPCRRARRTGPASAMSGPSRGGLGQREGDQLAALVLHPGRARGHLGQRRPGSPTRPGRPGGSAAPVGRRRRRRAGGRPARRRSIVRATSVTSPGRLSASSSASVSAHVRCGFGSRQGVVQRVDDPSRMRGGDGQMPATDPASRAGTHAVATSRSSQSSRAATARTARSTALANPVARGPTTARASSTVSATAACSPTRISCSWWTPRRSTSSSSGWTSPMAASTHAAEDRVVAAPPAQRSVAELGGEARRPARPGGARPGCGARRCWRRRPCASTAAQQVRREARRARSTRTPREPVPAAAPRAGRPRSRRAPGGAPVSQGARPARPERRGPSHPRASACAPRPGPRRAAPACVAVPTQDRVLGRARARRARSPATSGPAARDPA